MLPLGMFCGFAYSTGLAGNQQPMTSGGSSGIERRGSERKCSFPLIPFSLRCLRPQLLSPSPLPNSPAGEEIQLDRWVLPWEEGRAGSLTALRVWCDQLAHKTTFLRLTLCCLSPRLTSLWLAWKFHLEGLMASSPLPGAQLGGRGKARTRKQF